MENKVIAIIPARKGSKGIPSKNITKLNGKELIFYSIEAAIDSNLFDKICVISDCPSVLNIGKNYNIDTLENPAEISKDNSKIIEPICYALNHYLNKGINYDICVLLQPTSPLRTSKHICQAMNLFLENKNYSSLISFHEENSHPYKSFYLLDDNKIEPLFGEENVSKPRQLLPKVINQNGAIYINYSKDLLESKSFIIEPVFPFIMSEEDSIDIDTNIDLELANIVLNKNKEDKNVSR